MQNKSSNFKTTKKQFSTYLNPNFKDELMLAMLEVIDCVGIVSDRCIPLLKFEAFSKVALRCPLNKIG